MVPRSLPILLLACQGSAPAPQTQALVPASPAGVAEPLHSQGAVVYVPVYSSIYVGEGNHVFDLTVTLSIRNTDREHSITVVHADLHDTGGQVVHAYVAEPTVLGPLASADIVVRASDTRAGVGGAFVVEWRAGGVVTDPLVQAVMIGSASQQGISFVSEGRVLERLAAAEAAGPPG